MPRRSPYIRSAPIAPGAIFGVGCHDLHPRRFLFRSLAALLLNGRVFVSDAQLRVLIWPCLLLGLLFPVLLLVPSAHAIIAIYHERENRKHREIVDAIERHGPPLRAGDACPLSDLSRCAFPVDADRAALPVARRLDPGLVESALVEQMAAQQLRGLRFARGPGVAVAGLGQRQSPHRVEQWERGPRRATAAGAPCTQPRTVARLSKAYFSSSWPGDRRHHDGARAGRNSSSRRPIAGSAVSSPMNRYQSKSSGTTNDPRGPPTPSCWPGAACVAQSVAGPASCCSEVDQQRLSRPMFVAARRVVASRRALHRVALCVVRSRLRQRRHAAAR